MKAAVSEAGSARLLSPGNASECVFPPFGTGKMQNEEKSFPLKIQCGAVSFPPLPQGGIPFRQEKGPNVLDR